VEHVAGMAGLRSLIESMRGPYRSPLFATQISGLYGGLVYLTPVIGRAGSRIARSAAR